MADRYWVGGSGTWNTTSTTNWSASSGGASGASVPTTADNVIFDQAGTYTVTMTGALNCLDITVSAGVVTFATGTTPTLTVAGSWSTIAGTVWSSTGTVTFTSTTARTITSGGITIGAPFTFNGSGGSWTLQDNLTLGSALTTTLTTGTLALGSFTLTTGLFASSGTGVRTLNFGTGTIVLNPANSVTMWNTATVTNMTVSGTPLVITQASSTLTKTINSGALSEANSISFQINDTNGTTAFTAGNTVRNLTINSTSTISNIAITIYGNYTYTAATALTAGVNAWTFGATSGTKTINLGAGPTTHDFPFTINGTGGTFQLATNLTLGATRALTLTNGTFNQNAKTITASGITILTGSVTVNNLNVSQAITHTSGTLTLGTATTTGAYAFIAGTLSLGSLTLTIPSFASSGSTARTLAFGTGQLILTNNNATLLDITTATNFSTTGTVYINSTYAGAVGTRTFVTGFSEAQAAGYDVKTSGSTGIIIGTATDTVALTGNYNNFDLTGFTNTLSNTARTIYGSFTIPGSGGTLTAGTLATTFAGAGSETITTNGRTLDFPITFNATGTFSLADALTLGSTRTATLTAGTLSLQSFTLSCAAFSSSGATARTLAFGTGQLALVGNGATIFDVTTATNFSTTGTVYVNSTYSGATGTRTFVTGFTEAQAASYDVKTSGSTGIIFGTTATDTVAFTGSFNDFDLTGLTNTLSNTARTIYGNFAAPSSGGTITAGTAVTTLGTTGSKTVHTNGRSLDFPITVTLGSGTVTLSSNLTLGSTRTLTFTSGTFNFNNFVVNAGLFSSSNSNARTLAFGSSGQLTLTGNGVTVWDTTTGTNFVYTGTPNIFSSYTGATGTRTFNFGTIAEAYTFNVKFAASAQSNALTIAISTDILSISGNIKDFDLTNFTNTLATAARNLYGNLIVPATGGSLTATASATTFVGSSGTSTITTNGRSIPFGLAFNGAGKTFQQVDATTSTQALTLTAGTLDLNNLTFTALSLSSTGTGVRSISFGTTGQITVTNSGVTVIDFTDGTNFTWTGTHKIFASYTGATGTRTYAFGTIAEAYTFNVKFNSTAQANAVTIATSTDIASISGNIKDLDLTNFTNTFGAVARNIYGNLTIPATGGTITASGSQTTFVGSSGTSTITTNGRSVPIALTFNGAGKTFQQIGATTITQTLTLTAGTLDLNNATFTSTIFSSTNTNTRSILFGTTGQLSLTSSSATLIDISTGTNFSWTGNSKIVSTYASSVGTRTFTIGNTAAIDSAYAFDVIVGTGSGINLSASATDSLALTGIYNSVDLRGLSSTLTNTARSIAGNFYISATGGTYTGGASVTTFIGNTSTYIVDTATRVLDFPFTFQGSSTWNIANTFTSGSSTTVSTRTLTLTSGNVSFSSAQINCGYFSSTNTNSRNLDFGSSGRILLLGTASGVFWETTIGTNFTWTGNFDVDCNFVGIITKTFNFGTLSEAYAPNVKVATAGTGFGLNTTSPQETVALNGNIGNLDLTDFAGTLTNTARNVYGNLTFPVSGGTFTAGATATTLASTSGTETITYNGRTIDFPITINGTGGTFVANGNILLGATRTLTLTNGTFNANLANITASTITVASGNATVSNLSTTLTITHTSGDLNLNSNTSTGDYTLTAGNLNLNNYIVTTRTFSSSGSSVRAINFANTGKIQLLANTAVTYWNTGTPTNFSYTGNSNIITIGSGDGITKTITTGTMTEAQALNWTISDSCTTVPSTISFSASSVVKDLNVRTTTGVAYNIINSALTLYGNYNYEGSYTAGYSSVYIPGTGALSFSSINVGTVNPYTAECWFYNLDSFAAGERAIIGTTFTQGLNVRIVNSTTIRVDSYNNTGTNFTVPTMSTGVWYHLAVSRDASNQTTVFLNGTRSSTGVVTIAIGYGGTNRIGFTTGLTVFNGYISNVRLVNGSAVYDPTQSTITVPTTPLSYVANTTLLTCQTAAEVVDNSRTYNSGAPQSIGMNSSIASLFNPFNSNVYPTIGSGTNAWTFATTGTQTIKSGGLTHDMPFTFSGTGTYTLQDALNIGTTRTTTLTSGTLNLNDFNLLTGLFSSTNTNTRSIGFANTGKITLVANSASTYWNTSTPTNFSYTGNSNIETASVAQLTKTIHTGTMTEAQALSFNLKDIAGTIAFTANNAVKNLTPNGAFTLSNIPITIYGDYTYINATALTAGTSDWTFAGTGTKNISGGGVTHDFPFTFDGLNGIFVLQSALTSGTSRSIKLNNGTLDLNGYTLTGSSFTINTGVKSLQFDGGSMVLAGSGTAFNNADNNNFNISAGSGSGTISLTSASAKTFVGNNAIYTANLNQGGTGTLTVTGNNGFTDLSASISSTANTIISFTSNTTTTFNTFTLTGTATYRPTMNATTIRSRAYIASIANTNGIYNTGANYIQCRDIGFTPYSVDGSDYVRWFVGANSLSLDNNRGALFQNYDANNFSKVYVIESLSTNTWTIPSDFNVSNNTIHLFGGGGAGGDAFAVFNTNARGGGGGGGGGYTRITNLYAYKNQQINLQIGAGGISSSSNGSNTTLSSWYGNYYAGGGKNAGTGSANSLFGGLGGTGQTYNGGAGGQAEFTTSSSINQGGAGGAGAGGPSGVGGSGGNGIRGTALNSAGGGGGGNGGGTNGSNAATGTPGSGGNNAIGFGRGVGTSGDAVPSFSGGGGAGVTGSSTLTGGQGSEGIDILNSFGSAGGSGGSTGGTGNLNGAYGIFPGGGGGGAASRVLASGFGYGTGGAGGPGGVFIIYKPATAPTLSSNAFFTLFQN